MILLPIGHEENTVRRLPAVTFGIMALCVVLFVASGQGTLVSDDDIELQERFVEALEYYWEHPYLELDDEFEVLLYGEADGAEEVFGELAEQLGEWFDAGDVPPDVGAEQAELDRLTDAAIASRDEHTFFRWGLVPADFSIVGLVSHMFMHGGWLHLIGNLLILYLAGPFIEDVWGRPLYAAFYLLSGFAAAAAHIAFNSGSEVPMIGASGAIAGVMGAFLVHYHRTKIKFFYMVGFFVRGTFDAPAWMMLPLWLGEQVAMAVLVGEAVSGVAYWAHIGGFAFGALGALALSKAAIVERYVQPKLGDKIDTAVMQRPGLDQALVARGEGRHADAYDLLAAELNSRPDDLETAELLWEAAAELERGAAAAPLLLRSIQARLRKGETDGVCTLWERLVESDPTIQADPSFLLRLTQLQARRGNDEQARETLRRALMCAGAAPAPGLALKIARLGQTLEPAIARATLGALTRRADVGLEDKNAAEAQLERLASATVQVAATAEPEQVASHAEPVQVASHAEPIPVATPAESIPVAAAAEPAAPAPAEADSLAVDGEGDEETPQPIPLALD